jgi:DNA-binding transcriptional ArsR family regulator
VHTFSCLSILHNAVVAWNMIHIARIVAELRAEGHQNRSPVLNGCFRLDVLSTPARVVELRYFGGLTVDEISKALKVSPDTVMRDWRLAKTWLRRELSNNGT